MNLSLNIPLLLAAVLLASASARADDSALAVDELKQGYALKQGGHCREAIPHFTRSVALGATPKALLNLADCEQQTGDLVAAQRHAAQGRDLAREKNDVELVGVATTQLNGLDARLPRITVTLSRAAPPDSTVTRDGVTLDATSLGVPIAANPGPHAIVVEAPGHASKAYAVTLAESARSQLEVEPGAALGGGSSSPAAPGGASSRGEASDASNSSVRKPLAIGLAGLGIVGLTVGSVFGVLSKSAHNDADTHCQLGPQANLCDSQGVTSGNTAISRGDVSTWMFVGGAAALAAGAVIWFTTPREGASGIAVGVAPSLGAGGGLQVGGAW
jgi:hypothetical protein